MSSTTASSERLTEAEIVALSVRALLAHGASPAQSRSIAVAIGRVEAEGMRSHGLMYLPIYCEHLTCGKVMGTAEPVVSRPAPGTVTVDAACGFAHLAIARGTPDLVAAARTNGIGVLTVRNSYNCGSLCFHTEAIAREGLVALGFTNAPASIAPWGAVKPVLGTNPWSLAVPDGKGAVRFVIDQSASVVAKSEVVKRAKAGEPIPAGWALDASGRPTTDAEAALKGTMAPSGGYKGVGAAILVEVMAACLAGATPGVKASSFGTPAGGPPRTGQLFIAIDPGATSGGAFADRLATVAGALVAEPGARLPGDRRRAARERAAREGIEVDGPTLARVRTLAARRPG
jgi:(2R)-3-sulfolactate dehydrogenase (NADP+)